MAAGLAFALGIEQQIKGHVGLAQLIPECIEDLKAVVLLQPAVGCRNQQVNIGIGANGPACP